jgi:hypothetical protein
MSSGKRLPLFQNFDLNWPKQKFHHSLKEHHKISNIPKFRVMKILSRLVEFKILINMGLVHFRVTSVLTETSLAKLAIVCSKVGAGIGVTCMAGGP